ncbi:MAG TPA: pilus assembly protein TadG-related protein [Alphaproteobacteria bacterium]
MTRLASAFVDLWRDRRGAYSMVTALLLPVLAGFTAFGTEVGLWFYSHQAMQSAADAGAFSAATAYFSGSTAYSTEAKAVAASYGFVDGPSGNATVTVNKPPTSGPNVRTPDAIEVIVSQTQKRLFSAVVTSSTLTIGARAVAVSGIGGTGCVLSLDKTASVDISAKGTPNVVLSGCSMYDNSNSSSALTDSGNATISAKSVSVVGGISGLTHVTTTDGIKTGAAPISDPYADVTVPPYTPTCTPSSGSVLNPGVYCGLTIQSTVTLNPGLYVIDGGALTVNANANLTGTGVTIVLTSHTGSSYPTVTINGGATVNLSAPSDNTTGPAGFQGMQGIVMYEDGKAPVGTAVKLNGGSTQTFQGALYLPTAAATFTGGSTTNSACLQLVADTIAFGGNANFAISCSGAGTRPIGGSVALVE